jgi:hypothetical protein
LKVGPETAIRMFFFDYLRDHYAVDRRNVSMMERFLSGGVASFLAETVSYPLEVARIRMGLSKLNTYNGIFDCLRETYGRFGIRGVYAGLSIS